MAGNEKRLFRKEGGKMEVKMICIVFSYIK